MPSHQVNAQGTPPVRIGRRNSMKIVAAPLAGAATVGSVSTGIEGFRLSHPSPTERVSPLVQDGHIHSPTRIVWRGNAAKRRVALTFDDGPDPVWTPMVLALLEKHAARGTFFMLGSSVAEHP